MDIAFTKMHGLGNDFVVIDARQTGLQLTPEQSQFIAHRRFGVGCDQILVMQPAANAACFMQVINSDGTIDSICGNGIRCVASLLMAESSQDQVVIETKKGLHPIERTADGLIRVNMGQPLFEWDQVPLNAPQDTLHLIVPDMPQLPPGVTQSIGNPHTVFFVEDADAVPLAEWGEALENHPIFPERSNIEFCHIMGTDRIRMRVWERGSGITMACGSGACSVLVAAVRRGLVGRAAVVQLDGGELQIEWRGSDDQVYMTGPASEVFQGLIELPIKF